MAEASEKLDSPVLRTQALLGSARFLWRLSRYEEAENAANAARKLAEAAGDRKSVAFSLNNLGAAAHAQGRHQEAEQLWQESLQIKREIGDRSGIAMSLNNLGAVCIKQERFSDACKYVKEALQVSGEIAARDVNIEGLITYGYLLVMTGRLQEAAHLLFGAQRQAKEMECKPQPMEQSELDEGMAKLKDALSSEELAEAKARAEAMTLEELTEYALKALEGLGERD